MAQRTTSITTNTSQPTMPLFTHLNDVGTPPGNSFLRMFSILAPRHTAAPLPGIFGGLQPIAIAFNERAGGDDDDVYTPSYPPTPSTGNLADIESNSEYEPEPDTPDSAVLVDYDADAELRRLERAAFTLPHFRVTGPRRPRQCRAPLTHPVPVLAPAPAPARTPLHQRIVKRARKSKSRQPSTTSPRRSERTRAAPTPFPGMVPLPIIRRSPRSRHVAVPERSYRDLAVGNENESPAPSPVLRRVRRRAGKGGRDATFRPGQGEESE